MAGFLKISALLLVALACSVSAKPDKTVCYYGSWAVWRPGQGKFSVLDIDPFKCTHLIYTFVGISADATIRLNDPGLDNEAMPAFNNLKKQNPDLKTLIAIGGWNEGSTTFSNVAANAQLRTKFAQNALVFMKKYNFDGFDMDWEYPGQRGGSPNDKQTAPLLLQEMRKVFDASGKKYLITAAVSAAGKSVDLSYDVPKFSAPLDFINVMAYDFHGAFDGRTGQNAPLYSDDDLNVDSAVQGWISRGLSPNKLVLGMPVYGRSFTIKGQPGLNQPATPGTAGLFTGEGGMLGYNEICFYKAQGGWTDSWIDAQKVPAMYKGNQWVGYDDERSITLKAQYAVSKNLAGAMIWSIDTEDIHGLCKSKKFPILSAINQVLFGSDNASDNGGTVPTQKPTEKPTDKPTKPTNKPTKPTGKPGTDVCTGTGFFRDENDCSTYYYCQDDTIIGTYHCGAGTVFNDKLNICDWPANVPECQ